MRKIAVMDIDGDDASQRQNPLNVVLVGVCIEPVVEEDFEFGCIRRVYNQLFY